MTDDTGDDSVAGSADPPKNDEQVSSRAGKEQDIRHEEEKLLTQVVERSREMDVEAEQKVSQEISEARLAKPEVVIPDEVKNAGVKSPQNDAAEIAKNGSDLVLPIGEEDVKAGERVKVSGKTFRDKDVVGVLSVAGLAMLFGKLIKLAHKHAKRVIFRRKSDETNNGKESE